MANPNDPKTQPPSQQPTAADVLKLVEAMQAQQAKLIEALGENVSKGLREGMTLAAMAREQTDLNLATARSIRQSLGATCPKCRLPVKVCGGPEMKKVETPKLDDKGSPILGKDGKPEMVATMVEATKPTAEDANHVKMVVLPSNPAAARWFQWIGLNGVHFVSNRRGHPILVPRKNDFAGIISTFSNFEADFRESRKVKFNQGGRWSPKPLQFHNLPTHGRMGARMVS